jgi:uncharacterized protein (TIGR03435 family)
MRAVRCLTGFIAITLALTGSQALSQDRPSFEVASVRRAPPELQQGPAFARSPRPPVARASGQFDATATLLDLIVWAFGVDGERVEGSFRELDEVFVVTAKAAGPVSLVRRGEVGPMPQMVQSLLEDRFKLRVRWETRSFPVYALRRTTTDRLGKNLKPIEADCPAGYPETIAAAPVGCAVRIAVNGGRVQGVIPRMSDLTNTLAGFTGRRVVDETGIAGRFEFSFAFNPKTVDGPLAQIARAEDLPSLADALRDDLGLKLESSRRDFPVLIVEHVEQPTEN